MIGRILACMLLVGLLASIPAAARAQTPTPAPLITTGMVGCWPLDEASGTRADYVGSTALTDNNTVQVASGKIGNAALFDSANTEYLSKTSPTAINVGDEPFTWMVWVYPVVMSYGTQYLIKLSDSGVAAYMLSITTASFVWSMPRYSGLAVANNKVISTNEWYMVVAQYDPDNDQIGISVNNNSLATAAAALTVTGDTGTLLIGRGYTTHITRMDGMAMWKRLLSDSERTWLWNNGLGRSCAEMVTLQAPTTTPASQRSVALSSGDQAIINRELSYGDVAIMGMIGLLLVGLIVMGTISISERLYK
jgi:hypothetical protein